LTEMNELTAVAIIKGLDEECPFDHDDTSEDKTNDLVGVGTTLGERMAQGKSTRLGESGQAQTPAPIDDPKQLGLYQNQKPIRLPEYTPELFPLTCAAHHIIPAQASLRDSNLIKWLVHGSISSQTKDGSGTGKLAKNVGYDVNGAQNGVWLPGPYALSTDAVRTEMGLPTQPPPSGKKRVGPVEVLSKDMVDVAVLAAPNESPEAALEEEDTPPGGPSAAGPGGALDMTNRSGTARAPKLTKAPTQCTDPFPARYQYYFLYTVSAMQKVGAQYHDAHVDYSKRVKEALDDLEVMVDGFALGGLCSKCKDKNKQRDESSTDFPTPAGLIGKLDHISSTLRGILGGPPAMWMWPMLTSKFSLHYWVYSNDPALRMP
jgi:hypothetical protein